MADSLQTQNPIKVKRVSELPDYLTYLANYNLDKANSYVMISYPSNDTSIPHNYKITLSDLSYFIVNDAKNVIKPCSYNITYQVSYITYQIQPTQEPQELYWNTPHELDFNWNGENHKFPIYWEGVE